VHGGRWMRNLVLDQMQRFAQFVEKVIHIYLFSII
jgi:hypothetical protein